MNVFRSTPWVPALARRPRPEPSTNRNSSGCTSEVAIRSGSLTNRISSRRHTIRIARSSEPRLRLGTSTRTTGGAGRGGAVAP